MEFTKICIDEIIEATGEGDQRTLKTVDGHFLASQVEIIYTEPEPVPYASADERRIIMLPPSASPMHSLPA